MRFVPPTVQRALLALMLVPAIAGAQLSVLTNNVEEHEATPGSSYTGRIVIANTSDKPQTARIFQVDYRFLADGTTYYEDPGTNVRSNARWVTPQAQQVTVPAGGEVTVPYSVKVPMSDSLMGTYWSMILVEGATVAPAAAPAGKPTLGIGSVIRYGIQIATHIGQSGRRALKFENAAATKTTTGEASLALDVVSTGDRACRPKMSVELYDAQGVIQGKASQDRGLVYPGTSFRQQFTFGHLQPGTYKAVIYADTGDPTVLATQFTITY